MKKLYNYFMNKSVKQRIAICFVAVMLLVFLFFVIKANFFDIPLETAEGADEPSRPQFHISLLDIGLLLVTVAVYLIHKFREKRKQRRM
ncbi:MAG: hypothetical protein IKK42_03570 [Oscillospiraceae bacterium]|nr:hypothetical protein [Oscillospiraceae bacterium]